MHIAILGGGVAGVASAIALKLKGHDVTVHERRAGDANIGAGIVVWPNAAFVLAQFGILDDLAAVAGHPRAMRRLSRAGADLGALDIGLIEARMGYPSLSVLRSDFQRILSARLQALGVAVRYGRNVARIEPGAVVHFDDGTTLTADLVVGADGRMASCARRYVTGGNTPIYQGFINWIGVCEGEFDVDTISDYWGTGARFGIVPVARDKAYWAGGAAQATIGARDPDAYRDELQRLFADWPEPVRRIVATTPAARINKIYVHDHDPVPTWYRDNLVIIGDAAHAALPTSGQGACQALEDAWHLANCIEAHPGNVGQALQAFTALRFQKTAGITMAGRGLAASLFNRDEAFCRERDRASRHADYADLARAMADGWSRHLPL
ncbi:flavoprotein monooxygenase acting on aromatic compound [Massilia sp. Root133]|uniref:Flavoprotein monooxygenase acting on aromatic compound n=1 Tax=Massilia cellulosiltytica TaxID=2683234 RepID=A0A7X3FVS0_9BURK|nr:MULTISPECIES: FAD-dependent monooxygenase [Telluria group]KQY00147.1 flavoprotein monooxygenase acting on aromatic compound [Massilia sp. Root133]KQZ39122.1 flavoprotein monooxygenase acting on aromatic compound [Massilia sp. Root1485]MVW58913.1 flavoprotein monooxygenase acting on aromatic compound [Telluria cellulosilytica]